MQSKSERGKRRPLSNNGWLNGCILGGGPGGLGGGCSDWMFLSAAAAAKQGFVDYSAIHRPSLPCSCKLLSRGCSLDPPSALLALLALLEKKEGGKKERKGRAWRCINMILLFIGLASMTFS